MVTMARMRHVSGAEAVSAARKFRRYRPEEERPIRDADLKTGSTAKLLGIWSQLDAIVDEHNYEPGSLYPKALKKLKGLRCSAKDIEYMLAAFDSIREASKSGWFYETIGTFLSALINKAKEREFTLDTRLIHGEEIDELGYRNTKMLTILGNAGTATGGCMRKGVLRVRGNSGYMTGCRMTGGLLIVEGDTGEETGYEMTGGKIIVRGSAWDSVGGQMRGGEIVVEGNAGSWIGCSEMGPDSDRLYSMTGGKVTINGKAGADVGDDMQGGEIHLNGEFESIGNVISGRIFHKGKLIVDK
ncbi:MAG: hypothetical protein AB1529_00430 [Candidatus Micrarchaeota archaeon]